MDIEISNKKTKKFKYSNILQIKAIIIMCFQRQIKRKGINLFLLISPIFTLLFLLYIKSLVQNLIQEFGKLGNFQTFPIFLNLPYRNLLNLNFLPINNQECNIWFLYKLKNKNVDVDLLNNMLNPSFKEYCNKIKDYVPAFKKTENDVSKELIKQITELEKENLEVGMDLKNNYLLPDGAYEINQMNKNELDINISINDLMLYEMHRSNGFSKLKYKINDNFLDFKNIKDKLKSNIINKEPSKSNIIDDNFVNKYKKIIKNKYGGTSLISPNNAFLSMVDLITKSILKKFNPDVQLLSSYIYMNNFSSANFFLSSFYGLILGSILPLVFGGLLPIFISFLVYDRVENILTMMRIHGLKRRNYYIGMVLFFFILYLIQLFFIGTFTYTLLDFKFFNETDIRLLIIILLLWGLNQIGLSLIIQNFLNNNSIAFIFGYIIAITLLIISIYINICVYVFPNDPPFFLLLVPQLCFSRLIYLLNILCIDDRCVTKLPTEVEEINYMLFILFITSILYITIGCFMKYFIDNKDHFFNYFTFFLNKNKKKIIYNLNENFNNKNNNIIIHENEHEKEIENEIQKINKMDIKESEYSLVINKINKTFNQNNRIVEACKNISLRLKKNNIFCLLGPNGAGKSTLQSMLTGIIKPDNGIVYMNGEKLNFKKEIHNQNIGVCPQYDLLWEDLTIKEHLYFYCRLRGIDKSKNIEEHVDKILDEVLLNDHQDKRVDMLSGGLKRRLTLAISAVGNIDIIFLDEPTTGLDPKIRKNIWDILLNLKKSKSMILNTHLMEEAEILGDKISIILKGELKTLGSSEYLKNRYCNYLKLLINYESNEKLEKNKDSLIKFWEDKFKVEIIHEYKTTIFLKIYNDDILLEHLKAFIIKKDILEYNNYSIFQSDLKDVFEFIYNKYNN